MILPFPFQSTLKTNLPTWYVDCFKKAGFDWSGAWKNKKDSMHFEVEKILDKLPNIGGNNMTSTDLKTIEAKVDKLISKFGFTDRQG